ncbi:MAG TPA: ribonuclease [Sphingomicrobium sp.]|nr:ribonuclease [Sphingomicrobium sp.]
MPDWLVEHGIGETRLVRIEGREIAEARVLIDGAIAAGTILAARLKQAGVPALAVAGGAEYLLPAGAAGASEGAAISIEVTREAIPGGEPWKRPLARRADAEPPPPAPDGEEVPFPAPGDGLGAAGWWDLVDEARSGIVRFAGGELRVSPTPAMTLIDVDGRMEPEALALAGARAAARTIIRHGIGGSIGVDLPTVAGKAQRQAIAAAFDAILPQPFERTAVNGFGFLQVVRPRRHASLFELAADRPAFEARALLRRAAFASPGAARLAAHPAVVAVLESRPDWLDQLGRQLGGRVGLRADTKLPMCGGHVDQG